MDTDIRFIIADNQDITRAGLYKYIAELFNEEAAVSEATDKKGLISSLMDCNGRAVIILDYTLFDLNGVESLLIITRRFPSAHWILFSNELSDNLIRRLSVEKHISMILKENPKEEICAALKYARKGEQFFCHQITNQLLTFSANKEKGYNVLTGTETDILKLIAQGKSAKEIAALRTSSIHTIITHKKNIFRKLEVNNVYEATQYAIRAGLVEMVEYYI